MILNIKERLNLLARGDNLDLADIVCADAIARIEELEKALLEVQHERQEAASEDVEDSVHRQRKSACRAFHSSC